MKQPFKNTILGAAALFVLAEAAEAASTITIVDIPLTGSDAASGISSEYTYTHALDFGSQAGVAAYSINSVPITQAGISGNTFSGTDATSGKAWSISGNNQWHAGNTNTRSDGDTSKLLRDMYVPFSGAYTLTLSGITAGTDYSTRIYYRPWTNNSTRTATLTFNGDGAPEATTINQDAGTSAHYVAYDFTASGTSMTVNFSSSAWHLYGATNHVVIPEPSAALLGTLGMFFLLRRRRLAM